MRIFAFNFSTAFCRNNLMVVFTALSLSVFAGDVDKAFKALNAGEYANARKFLNEVLDDDAQSVAGNFGMAKFFSLNDNSAYNNDSAIYYIKKCSARIPLSPDDKETKRIASLGIRDFTIQSLERSINFDAYQLAERTNSIESYQHFIENFTDSVLLQKAIAFRNQRAYMKALASNTAAALDSFVKQYPDAAERNEAMDRYERLLYDETVSDQRYQSYKKYIDTYPYGKFVKEAKSRFEDKLLAHYNEMHTLDGYVEFVTRYKEHPAYSAIEDSIYVLSVPDGSLSQLTNFVKLHKTNKNYNNAWQEIYALSTALATPNTFIEFEKSYPEFPDKATLERDIKLAELELRPLQNDGKWGYAIQNASDSIVVTIPFEYEEAYSFSCGAAVVRSKPCEEKCDYFYIDKGNNRLFGSAYNYASDFQNGVAVVGLGDCESSDCRYGLIDKRGKFIVPAVYEELNDPTVGLYLALKNDKYGFLNARGEEKISFKYTNALPFSQGAAAVAIDENWFFIDTTGTQMFINRFLDCSSFSDSLCAATQDKVLWGYIDFSGQFVIEPAYENAEDFENGFAVVSKRIKDSKNKSLMISQRFKINKAGKVIELLTAPKSTAEKSGKRKGRR